MGWDAEIAVHFGTPDDPVKRFARVVAAFEAKPFRVIVGQARFHGPLPGEREQYILEELEGEAAAAAVEGLSERYAGARLAIEGWWHVPRFEPRSQRGKSRPAESSVVTTAVGDAYVFPVLRNEPAHLVYNLRNAYSFVPKITGDAARQNIELAVSELETFVLLGADRIRGLDMDTQAKPEECWFLYHRNIDGYADDLARVGGSSPRRLTAAKIRAAAESSRGVSIREAGKGFLIWRNDSVSLNLSEF